MALLLAVASLAISPSRASAAFGDLEVIPAGDPSGLGFTTSVSTTQAGGHPEGVTSFNVTPLFTGLEWQTYGNPLRETVVDLPPGVLANPSAVAKCPVRLLADGSSDFARCFPSSQVGYVKVTRGFAEWGYQKDVVAGLYMMETAPDELAVLGFNVGGAAVTIAASVRASDNGVRLTTRNTPQVPFVPVVGAEVTVWGVPADPGHDEQRCAYPNQTTPIPICDGTSYPAEGGFTTDADIPHSAGKEPEPFFTNPTVCDAPKTTTIRVRSWVGPGALSSPFEADSPTPTGCEAVPFDAVLKARPTSSRADSPSGLVVDLSVPQNDDPNGLATSHLRKAVVTLPEGMAVNPASADGLQACTPAQIGLGTSSEVACPAGSKIGTVEVETPVLDDPLHGDVYLAKQSDNPFGSLIALYMVARGPGGLVLKLPGRVDADPQTGRLTTTFDDNPQLPFSNLHLELKSGSRAPLTMPSECGTYTTHSELTSWSGKTVESDSHFTVDEGCGPRGFAPAWSAGSTNPVAGGFSPFVAAFSRGDHEQAFDDLTVEMPEGMIAKLKGVLLCPEVNAVSGTCSAASRIGSATTGAGAGANPFYLSDQPVYLTGPYKGAPYGLAVVVRALAGPFDLGTVVVRQAIHVDPETARLSIASDPLPRILQGIPLNIRDVRVNVDRPQFAINPTSCAEKEVGATLRSTQGAVHEVSTRFQVGDCQALAFKPRLAMRLVGKGRTRTGAHPALRSVLSQGGGQAGIRAATVRLPKSIVLDNENAYDPALVCAYDDAQKANCPASSVIGSARAVTPVLNRPLSGPVHLVQGIRFGPNGRRIRTLPSLLVKLRGEVAINVRAQSAVENGRLVTKFPAVPDAPVSRFTLSIKGGKKGILTVTRTRRGNINLCNSRQTALVETDGHNGKRADYPTRVKTPCAKRKAKRAGGRR